MKTKLFLLLVVVITCTSVSVEGDQVPAFRSSYEPVFVTRSELEKSIQLTNTRPVKSSGKIYSLPPYIFMVEKTKGIHVIDNTDIKNPKNIRFILFPGIVDIAIKDGVLYGNNSIDLVGININDPQKITEVSRIKNFFPEPVPPDYYDDTYTVSNRPEGTIVLAWKQKTN